MRRSTNLTGGFGDAEDVCILRLELRIGVGKHFPILGFLAYIGVDGTLKELIGKKIDWKKRINKAKSKILV